MDHDTERRDSLASSHHTDFTHGTLRLERRMQQFKATATTFERRANSIDAVLDRKHGEIILHPIPSNDPNDPLNWKKWYKALNFGLVSFYTLMVFVNVDIGTVTWLALNTELNLSFAVLTGSFGLCCAGLAVGCVLFIPFALKFGRRPVYLVSITVSLAAAVWSARMMNAGDLLGTNLVGGLAGSIAETICQMTIADIFFVHQRGTANGVYLLMVNMGAFLAPVAAGYAADSMGWRWIWWWTAIFFAACLLLYIFLYEETKYEPVEHGVMPTASPEILEQLPNLDSTKEAGSGGDLKTAELGISTTTERLVDRSIQRKTYRERLALFPPNTDFTGGWGVLVKHAYQPFIIITTFPAITYSALMYGSILAWFSVIVNVWSIYFILPPYNFSASGIGLMNLPPFIGGIVGSLYGGLLNDWLIIKLARRNKGIFEPEMRLWVALPAVLAMPASILLFGLATANGLHWIVPCIGSGIFGFAMVTLGDVGLTYAMDCYVEIIGDALVGVCFIRNLLATIISVSLTYWIEGVGLSNMIIMSAVLAFALSVTTVPMIIYGKRARRWTEERRQKMTAQQFGSRG